MNGHATARLAAFLTGAALLGAPALLHAQTPTDGIMMPARQLCTGFVYEHDRWSDYWEGTLERDNLNIGSVTTQSLSWVATYGVTSRVNVIAMAPYVWTSPSAGTLRGQSGLQDLSLALKVQALTLPAGGGAFKAFAVGSVGVPMSDYTPDFYPLSLGSHSRRISGRGTVNYTSGGGLYVNGTGGYTWRDNVTLDRSSYYTEGRLVYSNEVAMPDMYDLAVSVGYNRGRILAPLTYVRQVTRGGSDIRRQDMPFVSNRMNASRIDASLLYYLPKLPDLGLKAGVARTLTGRNVGRSTTLSAGVLYVFHFR